MPDVLNLYVKANGVELEGLESVDRKRVIYGNARTMG